MGFFFTLSTKSQTFYKLFFLIAPNLHYFGPVRRLGQTDCADKNTFLKPQIFFP